MNNYRLMYFLGYVHSAYIYMYIHCVHPYIIKSNTETNEPEKLIKIKTIKG